MELEIKKSEDTVVVEIAGRIDTLTAPALEKALSENIQGEKNLILDFKGVEYISSAGLRTLLSAQKKMQQVGSMKLKNVIEEVMDVFEMTGFADILNIE